jgi:hypothetical protein
MSPETSGNILANISSQHPAAVLEWASPAEGHDALNLGVQVDTPHVTHVY